MITTPEDLAAFPNRYAGEREIEAAETPAPGTMHFNDGHERVRLPGGTLRRMLATIDRLAAMASSAQQGEPVAWMDEFGNTFPLGAHSMTGKLSWQDAHKRNWKPLYTRPTAPAEPGSAARADAVLRGIGQGLRPADPVTEACRFDTIRDAARSTGFVTNRQATELANAVIAALQANDTTKGK